MFWGPMTVAPSVSRMASGSEVESSLHRGPFGSSLANGTVSEVGGAEDVDNGAVLPEWARALDALDATALAETEAAELAEAEAAELAEANALDTAELADANAVEARELAGAEDPTAGAAIEYLARTTAQRMALVKVSIVRC